MSSSGQGRHSSAGGEGVVCNPLHLGPSARKKLWSHTCQPCRCWSGSDVSAGELPAPHAGHCEHAGRARRLWLAAQLEVRDGSGKRETQSSPSRSRAGEQSWDMRCSSGADVCLSAAAENVFARWSAPGRSSWQNFETQHSTAQHSIVVCTRLSEGMLRHANHRPSTAKLNKELVASSS